MHLFSMHARVEPFLKEKQDLMTHLKLSNKPSQIGRIELMHACGVQTIVVATRVIAIFGHHHPKALEPFGAYILDQVLTKQKHATMNYQQNASIAAFVPKNNIFVSTFERTDGGHDDICVHFLCYALVCLTKIDVGLRSLLLLNLQKQLFSASASLSRCQNGAGHHDNNASAIILMTHLVASGEKREEIMPLISWILRLLPAANEHLTTQILVFFRLGIGKTDQLSWVEKEEQLRPPIEQTLMKYGLLTKAQARASSSYRFSHEEETKGEEPEVELDLSSIDFVAFALRFERLNSQIFLGIPILNDRRHDQDDDNIDDHQEVQTRQTKTRKKKKRRKRLRQRIDPIDDEEEDKSSEDDSLLEEKDNIDSADHNNSNPEEDDDDDELQGMEEEIVEMSEEEEEEETLTHEATINLSVLSLVQKLESELLLLSEIWKGTIMLIIRSSFKTKSDLTHTHHWVFLKHQLSPECTEKWDEVRSIKLKLKYEHLNVHEKNELVAKCLLLGWIFMCALMLQSQTCNMYLQWHREHHNKEEATFDATGFCLAMSHVFQLNVYLQNTMKILETLCTAMNNTSSSSGNQSNASRPSWIKTEYIIKQKALMYLLQHHFFFFFQPDHGASCPLPVLASVSDSTTTTKRSRWTSHDLSKHHHQFVPFQLDTCISFCLYQRSATVAQKMKCLESILMGSLDQDHDDVSFLCQHKGLLDSTTTASSSRTPTAYFSFLNDQLEQSQSHQSSSSARRTLEQELLDWSNMSQDQTRFIPWLVRQAQVYLTKGFQPPTHDHHEDHHELDVSSSSIPPMYMSLLSSKEPQEWKALERPDKVSREDIVYFLLFVYTFLYRVLQWTHDRSSFQSRSVQSWITHPDARPLLRQLVRGINTSISNDDDDSSSSKYHDNNDDDNDDDPHALAECVYQFFQRQYLACQDVVLSAMILQCCEVLSRDVCNIRHLALVYRHALERHYPLECPRYNPAFVQLAFDLRCSRTFYSTSSSSSSSTTGEREAIETLLGPCAAQELVHSRRFEPPTQAQMATLHLRHSILRTWRCSSNAQAIEFLEQLTTALEDIVVWVRNTKKKKTSKTSTSDPDMIAVLDGEHLLIKSITIHSWGHVFDLIFHCALFSIFRTVLPKKESRTNAARNNKGLPHWGPYQEIVRISCLFQRLCRVFQRVWTSSKSKISPSTHSTKTILPLPSWSISQLLQCCKAIFPTLMFKLKYCISWRQHQRSRSWGNLKYLGLVFDEAEDVVESVTNVVLKIETLVATRMTMKKTRQHLALDDQLTTSRNGSIGTPLDHAKLVSQIRFQMEEFQESCIELRQQHCLFGHHHHHDSNDSNDLRKNDHTTPRRSAGERYQEEGFLKYHIIPVTECSLSRSRVASSASVTKRWTVKTHETTKIRKIIRSSDEREPTTTEEVDDFEKKHVFQETVDDDPEGVGSNHDDRDNHESEDDLDKENHHHNIDSDEYDAQEDQDITFHAKSTQDIASVVSSSSTTITSSWADTHDFSTLVFDFKQHHSHTHES